VYNGLISALTISPLCGVGMGYGMGAKASYTLISAREDLYDKRFDSMAVCLGIGEGRSY
jgi:hypothetical protein